MYLGCSLFCCHSAHLTAKLPFAATSAVPSISYVMCSPREKALSSLPSPCCVKPNISSKHIHSYTYPTSFVWLNWCSGSSSKVTKLGCEQKVTALIPAANKEKGRGNRTVRLYLLSATIITTPLRKAGSSTVAEYKILCCFYISPVPFCLGSYESPAPFTCGLLHLELIGEVFPNMADRCSFEGSFAVDVVLTHVF